MSLSIFKKEDPDHLHFFVYGLKDSYGQEIIPATYYYIADYNNGFYRAEYSYISDYKWRSTSLGTDIIYENGMVIHQHMPYYDFLLESLQKIDDIKIRYKSLLTTTVKQREIDKCYERAKKEIEQIQKSLKEAKRYYENQKSLEPSKKSAIHDIDNL